MKIDQCFKIGYVSKTHGLKGEVTVNTLPECPDLTSIKTLYLSDNLIPHFIETISVKGDKAYLKLEGINKIEQAAQLKGASLYLPKSERPKLEKGRVL
ncbi:MAG: hypothetical protein WDO15_03385 [Bacteroidota bacterium]